MIRKIVHSCGILVWILMGGIASGQPVQHKALIDSVIQPGFYAINITPELSSLLKTDFSNLRIKDNKGNPVPYFMGSEIRMKDTAHFAPLVVLKNLVNDSGQTVLVVENSKKEKLDEFYLRIQNAAVSRTISLSGGNDGLKWYSIIENVTLEKRFVQDHDSFLENISFPLSSYKYFRIIIYNGKNDPLDILSVQKRIQMNPVRTDTLIKNPPGSFVRKDSAGMTWLTVQNAGKYHINTVLLKVESPRFYRRQADVIIGGEPVGNFLISSDTIIYLNLPLFNDSAFTIKIYNEDNSPLVIAGISTGQNAEKIIAYFESGKSYELEMIGEPATKPHYDLVSFKDTIPKDVKLIGLSEIIKISTIKEAGDKGFRQYWLWLVLIFVLLMLGLFTYRLIKEIAKRPD